MRKFLLAPILTVVMVATVLFGALFVMKPEAAKAEEVTPAVAAACDPITGTLLCARRVGNNLRLETLAGTVVAEVPLPQVTVTAPTIRVTLPRVTVVRPPVTVTLPRVTVSGRTLPGQTVTLPRQTVTVELPQATETVTLPRQTTTVPTPSVATVTVTGPDGQPIQTSVTITPSPLPGAITTKPVVKEREVRVSVPAAIGIGVGVLLLGLILGLLAIYVAYAVGYKDSEDAERTKWQKFRDELFGRKDEGEN
jgi:hypothetical protein